MLLSNYVDAHMSIVDEFQLALLDGTASAKQQGADLEVPSST